MIVASNTSPLTSLAAIQQQFELLRLLYEHIHIPEAVREELNSQNTQWPGSTDVAAADWVEVHDVQKQSLVQVLQRTNQSLHWHLNHLFKKHPSLPDFGK